MCAMEDSNLCRVSMRMEGDLAAKALGPDPDNDDDKDEEEEEQDRCPGCHQT